MALSERWNASLTPGEGRIALNERWNASVSGVNSLSIHLGHLAVSHSTGLRKPSVPPPEIVPKLILTCFGAKNDAKTI